eukprot:3177217-Pyramimonas_sp.AAC.1
MSSSVPLLRHHPPRAQPARVAIAAALVGRSICVSESFQGANFLVAYLCARRSCPQLLAICSLIRFSPEAAFQELDRKVSPK